jgi:hypothetical protein
MILLGEMPVQIVAHPIHPAEQRRRDRPMDPICSSACIAHVTD